MWQFLLRFVIKGNKLSIINKNVETLGKCYLMVWIYFQGLKNNTFGIVTIIQISHKQ